MDKRFLAGLVATGLWLALFAVMLFGPIEKMALRDINLWGDTFAGFFAPLAFLWLVLGYMQQGDELRLTRQTLNLQAQELKNSVEAQTKQAEETKNSVEQQRQLVELYRQMLQSQLNAIEEERRRTWLAKQPQFVFASEGYGRMRGALQISWRLRLMNHGRTATNVSVLCEPPPKLLSLKTIDAVPEDFSKLYTLDVATVPEIFTLRITYTDVDNEIQRQEFTVAVGGDEPPTLSFYKLSQRPLEIEVISREA